MSAATPALQLPPSSLPPKATAELPEMPWLHVTGASRSTPGQTWNHVGVKLIARPKKFFAGLSIAV